MRFIQRKDGRLQNGSWWFESIISCHMRSLFFAGRHGETVLNQSGRYRGLSNGPDAQLNENGVQSAHDLGNFFKKLNQNFTAIVVSPLDRAQHTGAIIAGYVGIKELIVDDRLLPLDVGDYQGQLKEENPIQPFLKDKNKKFPNGESINQFEHRQYQFGLWLMGQIEAHKVDEDNEILMLAHVSNIMYWWNLQTNANSEEYLDERSDLVRPGGAAVITEHSCIPIFKANESSDAEGSSVLPPYPQDHEVGMEVPEGGSNCDKCEYLKAPQICGQPQFIEWDGSKFGKPLRSDRIPKPTNRYCCDFFEEK